MPAHSLTHTESSAISYLRVIAMLSIVACHFMQALGSRWAWVFNIGVQVFLLISGYLYGHKTVNGWGAWFYRRIERIYIPFLLFIIVVVPLYVIKGMITWKQIVIYIADLQGIMGGVKGLGHLWFLTAIAICYITTPLLQWFRKYSGILIWLAVIGFFAVEMLCPRRGFMASWVVLYAIGYYLASIGKREKVLLFALSLLALTWSIAHITWETMINQNDVYNLTMHISGAILILILFLLLFKSFNIVEAPSAIKVVDKYSLYVYIVHHILIMPPFGLIHITSNVYLNILIIVLSVALSAMVLKRISDKITERLRLLLKIR